MKKWLLILIGIVLAGIVGYKIAYPSLDFHVRLTIEVEQHGEKKSASSVIELRETASPSFGGVFRGYDLGSRGEAVFLDLGDGNNLFALLGIGGGSQDDIITITHNVFFNGSRRTDPDYGTPAYSYRILSENMNRPRTLGPNVMPTLARFRDLMDPKTIEPVDPEHLEKSYGPDITFTRATLEITKDPVTSGVVEDRLPWLRKMIGSSPLDHLPSYDTRQPELSQETIFFHWIYKEVTRPFRFFSPFSRWTHRRIWILTLSRKNFWF